MVRQSFIVLGLVVALAGCKFDSAGISGDDTGFDAGPDDDGNNAGDAGPDAELEPDAMPPDGDGDTVRDSLDNCPAIANTTQYDEDDDGDGDVCDNCPHIANASQASRDGDPVGDACDPEPGLTGDAIFYFDGFNGTTRAAGWTAGAGDDTWTVSGGALRQTEATRQQKILYYQPLDLLDATVDTAFTPTMIPPSSSGADAARSGGIMTGYATGVTGGSGRYTLAVDQIDDEAAAYLAVGALSDGGGTSSNATTDLESVLSLVRYTVRATVGVAGHDGTATENGTTTVTASAVVTPTTGRVGVRTRALAAQFEYIVVFGLSPVTQ